MKKLVEKGAEINVQNKNGETPLHQAVRHENNVAVEFLLHCPDIDLTIVNKYDNIFMLFFFF